MKIIIMADMEGAAGVVSFSEQAFSNGKYYEQAKRLLTLEVNAAVEGALKAGVTEVLVMDWHGVGGINFEELHPEARFEHRGVASSEILANVHRAYDAFMMIGMHAQSGIQLGNMNHTQCSQTIEWYALNGKKIGEIAQAALDFGELGLPLIFVSGDDAACREAMELVPGIKTAAVKQGLGREKAISLSAVKARELISQTAKQAVLDHKKCNLSPVRWKAPYSLEIRYFHTDMADKMQNLYMGAERVDSQTILLRSQNIREIIYR